MLKFRFFSVLIASLMLIASTGCMGRMALSKKITAFNMGVSDNNWAREATFFGLYIIPVYPTCGFIDLMFINSVEFWTDKNPLSGESALTRE